MKNALLLTLLCEVIQREDGIYRLLFGLNYKDMILLQHIHTIFLSKLQDFQRKLSLDYSYL